MSDIYFDTQPTIGELIEHLSQFDPKLPVLVESPEGSEYRIQSIDDYADSKYKRIVISVDWD